MINDGHAIQLSYGIRLRQECFGGLIYDTRNGNTLEVDRQAFLFLEMLNDRPAKVRNVMNDLIERGIIKCGHSTIKPIIRRLLDLKILEDADEAPSLQIRNDPALYPSQQTPWFSAPETVHWAVTYRCNQKCPDCYTGRFSFPKSELTTREALMVIDKMVRWQIFQLTFGGGEPFLRKDLPQLVKHAAEQGLSVHITTGRLDIAPNILEAVLPSVKSLQLGIQNDHLLGMGSKKYLNRLKDTFGRIQQGGAIPGANVILTRSAIQQLECIVNFLSDIGFKRIIFLRYKPPPNVRRWETELPAPRQMQGLHRILGKVAKQNPLLAVRVDCALSLVQRFLRRQTATQHGIKGCVAADRILALAPDGSVYPCSQLVHPQCYAGNLLKSEPETLWAESPILQKYRSFRMGKTFVTSGCGVCPAKSVCGGCRVFARDGIGGDPGCPNSLQSVSNQMDKMGKRSGKEKI